MQTAAQTAPSTTMLWAGRVISALAVLFLIFDGVIKVIQASPAMEATTRLGYAGNLVFGIGVLELACVILYVIPQTSVLGAILLTGYLGGATATHMRIDDPFFMPIVLGVVIWLGVFLRDRRLWSLIPWRT